MSDKPEPSKRSNTMSDRAKTTENVSHNSDDHISAGSDVDTVYSDSDTSSESEEDDTNVHTDQTPSWSTDFGSMKEIPFTRTNELRVSVGNTPRDYFDLFLDEEYLQKIVNCSNKYADVLKRTPHQAQSRIVQWKPLTVEELKIFIGLVLHTGTAKLGRVVDYWKSHRLYASVFSWYMSRNRFQLILRCLHFGDDAEDSLSKCRLVVDNFNSVMESIYYPGKNLSIDESMSLWRGRPIFRHHNNNKPHKSGIKLYTLAEPNGAILKLHVTTRTAGKKPEQIVEKLLDGKLHAGHAVFMDNHYNSYSLAAKLLDQNTYCTGTLKNKRRDNPPGAFTKKQKRGENVSLCCNGVHVGKWQGKKETTYITTEFPNKMEEVTTKRGDVVPKPAAVVSYNKIMSAVDLEEQLLKYYPCQRITSRWHVSIFVHVLMMSLINARVLFNRCSGDKSMTLYDFRERIVESYLPEVVEESRPQQKRPASDQHKLTKIENVKQRLLSSGNVVNATLRKDCRNCYRNKKRVNVTTECRNCPGSPPLCIDCFFELHDCIAKCDDA